MPEGFNLVRGPIANVENRDCTFGEPLCFIPVGVLFRAFCELHFEFKDGTFPVREPDSERHQDRDQRRNGNYPEPPDSVAGVR